MHDIHIRVCVYCKSIVDLHINIYTYAYTYVRVCITYPMYIFI